MKERALLVTVEFDSMRKEASFEDYAKELEDLASSAGLDVVRIIRVRMKNPSPKHLIGKGKAEEIGHFVTNEKIQVVVFSSNLAGTQQRNLEEAIHAKTIDRTQLILDIFAQRARTNEGKLQVELAQLNYLLPRLTGKGIALSRLGGGVGTRGPGEQKLEVDRRKIRDRISRLSKELEKLHERRSESIRKKKEKELSLISLVGYTNAGKSTLFNALTGAGMVEKDQLFSTLDTTTRLLVLPGNQKVFLADTVGFVRELPHHLVEAFKSTLEEARQADLLLHVVDASRPDVALLMEAVEKVLQQLHIETKKVLLVLNKIDLSVTGKDHSSLPLKDRAFISVSAKTGQGINDLCLKVSQMLASGRGVIELFVPKEKLGLTHWLYEEGEVFERRDTSRGAHFKVRLSEKDRAVFMSKLTR